MENQPLQPLGFLQHLRPVEQPAGERRRSAPFYFKIKGQPGAWRLETTTFAGKPISVAPGGYDGPTAHLLRLLSQAESSLDIAASWGIPKAQAKTGRGIDLQANPDVMFQLVLCDNIIGPDNSKLSVSTESVRLTLALTEDTANPGMLVPILRLDGVEDAESDKPDPQETADEKSGTTITRFTLLSDSFALAGHKIYPIQTLGPNSTQLHVFLSPFAADLADAYLSVLFSYLPDIRLDFAGRAVKRVDSEIVVQPVIAIEKLGADKALYMRLRQGTPGHMGDLVSQLGLTVAASVSENTVTVRPLSRFDMEEKSVELLAEIKKYAPTAAQGRDIYYDDEGLFIIPEATAAPFLFRGLPTLLNQYQITGTDKLRAFKLTPVSPKLNLRMSSGIDFLEGDATVDLGSESMTLAELLEQYRRNHYVTLSDGSRGIMDPAYVRRLERIFKPADGSKGAAIKISFFDMPEVAELLGARISDTKAFERPRKFYRGFNTIGRGKLDLTDVHATLRPYQEYGVKWFDYLYANKLGGCLADDMGLGKTLQTIAFITRVQPQAEAPTLIVMPRSLLFNWQAEFARFAPGITVHTYYGQTRDLDEALKSQVILTTYALVRNDIELLLKHKFHMVVLDESQNIKNISTGISKSVHLLDADHRFALSGTPIENNLLELYSLFSFLNPAMFGSADDFSRRYASPIQQNDDTDALADLRRRIFPFMLRRVKKEVLSELPDRMDQTLTVDMEPEQARLYEQRRTFYKERVSESISTQGLAKSHFVMFQALNELRRIASVPESLTDGRVHSAKLDLLLEHILEAAANGHKSVVFFNFIAGIEIIGDRLQQEGIDYACMTGSTTDRRSVVERFQNDSACRVLLMTLKTGGVGLNLVAADTVFIVEPWWNKAAEEQAINRLHRFGQKAKVSCYSLITRGTIEEKIRELQQRKADLFEEVITADSTQPKKLTEDDINFILS